jgi:hypothetical protein
VEEAEQEAAILTPSLCVELQTLVAVVVEMVGETQAVPQAAVVQELLLLDT